MSGVTLVYVVGFGDVVLAGFGEGLCVLLLLSFGLGNGSQVGFGERVCVSLLLFGSGEGC